MSSTTSAPRTPRRASAAPAGRLPVPTRDRRPALAALAVLLILGGALVSGLIALRSGERVDYLALSRDVGAGEQITKEDVTLLALAGGDEAKLLTRRSLVVGHYARNSLPAGTLVTSSMIEDEPSVPADSAVVGIALTDAQAPAEPLPYAAVVQVLSVPTRGSDGAPVVLVKAAKIVSGATSATAGRESTDIARSNGLSISVVVPRDAAADVAAASSGGTAAVVLLPPGTKTTVG